jgi:hypothetical protein
MHQFKGWLAGVILVSSGLSMASCNDADSASLEPSASDSVSEGLVARGCGSDSDCPVPLVACRQCPDGVNFSCPEPVCRSGQCGIQWAPCPGLIQCGGIAGSRCPDGFDCVDDPRDDCSPCRGGADCGGICVQLTCKAACDPKLICTQVVTCVDGLQYPTGCGPKNCDKPIGVCSATTL